MSELTDTRGAAYGPPWEHHAKTARLIGILLDGHAPANAIQWQACMILDKLVRLSHAWTHRDSIDDIVGYGECMQMTMDRWTGEWPAMTESARAAKRGSFRLLDLFSGIGGFSLAAHSLGMETLAFCEIEPYPVRVLNRHFEGVPVFPDVKELTADALAHAAGVRPSAASEAEGGTTWGGVRQSTRGSSRPLILTAGFPCQDLSYAGKGAGLGGERSGLYSEVIRLVRALHPEWVLLENVNAILTRGVGTVLADLAACGYGWAYCCIPACAVGAPHRRDRWWAVAWPSLGDEQDRRRGERIVTSVLNGLTPFGDLADGWPTATATDAWASERERESSRQTQPRPRSCSTTWPTPIANEAEKRGDHHEGLRGAVADTDRR